MMAERRGGPRDRSLRKIVAAVASGVIAFSVASAVNWGREPDLLFEVAASVFIAGVAFVVMFLVDVEHSLEDVHRKQEESVRRIEERVSSGLFRLNEATELFSAMEASPIRAGDLVDFVRYTSQLPPATKLVVQFANAELGRLSQLMKDLSSGGDVTYDGANDWILGLTDSAEFTLDAVSIVTADAGGRAVVDGDLWTTDLGQRYLEAQSRAVERGLLIRRVFVLDRPELGEDSSLRQITGWQLDRGLRVRTIEPGAIPLTLRLSINEFAIFDGVVGFETQSASAPLMGERPLIMRTRLSLRMDRVRQQIQRFEALWSAAADPG
jgi:hypothetical protein